MRFASQRGMLNLEQLWDVPLRSRDEFDLDAIAKSANRIRKEVGEESFVAARKTANQKDSEIRLELVKHVIAVKLEEEAQRAAVADRVKEKEKLTAILEKKQDAALEDLDEEAIKARIAELNA